MHYPVRVLVSLDLSLEQFSLHVQIGGDIIFLRPNVHTLLKLGSSNW